VRAGQERVQPRLTQEAEHADGRTPERLRAGNAGEVFHRGVPGDHHQTRVGDDHRVGKTADESVSEVVHGSPEYS
jgi:hypothetical protein